jgi:putative oxidoreductase
LKETPVNTPTFQSAGLLVLRLVVGTTFLVHGVDKLGDLSAAEQFFAAQSIPEPGLMAPLVGATETIGGLALILGLATPLVAAALTADMLVALFTTHIAHGFFVDAGGFEHVLLLAGASLTLALAGPGRCSVDARSRLSRLNPALLRATRNLT